MKNLLIVLFLFVSLAGFSITLPTNCDPNATPNMAQMYGAIPTVVVQTNGDNSAGFGVAYEPPVVYIPMTENTGSNIVDYGFGHWQTGLQWPMAWSNIDIGTCLYMTNDNQHQIIYYGSPSMTNLAGLTSLSAVVFVKVAYSNANTANNGVLMANGFNSALGSGSWSFGMNLLTTNQFRLWDTDTNSSTHNFVLTAPTGFSIYDGQWHQVGFTYNWTTHELYLICDGALYSKQSSVTPLKGRTDLFFIIGGQINSFPNPDFTGYFSECSVFSHPLTQPELYRMNNAFYQKGKIYFGNSFILQSNSWATASLITNSMPNFSTAEASSNGTPVKIYMSNTVPFIYYETPPAGGILP